MSRPFRVQRELWKFLLPVALFLCAVSALAAPAGTVEFTAGTVTATMLDGTVRNLVKGKEVLAGDTLNTGSEGRLHIRFTDGAYLSLQPDTLFKIDNYVFNGKIDGDERGVFNLIKGGLRKITGSIGKVNRSNYAVTTPAATIGIRGTTYSALQNDDGLTVTVGQGIVVVTNERGSLSLIAGQSGFVRSRITPPGMMREKVLLPRLQERERAREANSVRLAERSGSEGRTQAFIDASTRTSPALTQGVGYSVGYAASDASNTHPGLNGVRFAAADFDANGSMTGFTDGSSGLRLSGTVAEAGSDQVIGWGRWIGDAVGNAPGRGKYGTAEGLHYVVGIATPVSNLPIGSGAEVIYSFSGGTKPTTNDSSLSTSLSGVNAVVKFSAPPTVTLDFDVTVGAHNYRFADAGATELSGLPRDGLALFRATPTGIACQGAACRVEINGMFAGPRAEKLGLVYHIVDTGGGGIFTKGAVVFAR